MQARLKYKLYGEFSDYEVNELQAWFLSEILKTKDNTKNLKITIDWEPNAEV